ncbi:MAG: hypothetical protein JNK21_02760, partial [Rhodospirillaceae bacterium]|nr:hypothetical protein [Rhodospirillaceae bacterium]
MHPDKPPQTDEPPVLEAAMPLDAPPAVDAVPKADMAPGGGGLNVLTAAIATLPPKPGVYRMLN